MAQTLLDFADTDAPLEGDGFAIGWAHAQHGIVPGQRAGLEPWTEDQWARGAASLVLASLFDSAGGEQSRMVRDRLGNGAR